jgi:histone-lysine N-methyltransferase SETMAR
MLSKKVLLHHDNARPHTAAATVETVQQPGFERLQHPPYSPDLVLSDYHIFGPLKEALRGRRFTSDEEVKEAMHTWLQQQPKSFFSAGIQELVDRYNKRIVLQGDYVEK